MRRQPMHEFKDATPITPMIDIDMSVRLYNSLSHYCKVESIPYRTVGDLSAVSISKFEAIQGVGAVQVRELKALCKAAGISTRK